ncbi:tyrosine-type recombinase/integrase [Desulfotomaculum sp. 1211_IL3151]|uniref:tyrosine-type recombinase/integrase n=1 Tax=Desulfotomaculum sp. 1211_IL3151 TaxID=3084055 RepID=UPI002FD9CA96
MSDNIPFREIINNFIAEKRAVGYKFIKNEKHLRRVALLYEQMGYNEPVLTKDLVHKWTEKTLYEKETNRLHRISVIRGLAEYMQRMGYDAYFFPFRSVPYQEGTYVPHIYSNKELAGFFTEIDKCASTETTPFRQIQFSLLFRLLYGTGMRISEVLSLTKDDLDLKAGTVFIKQTKFGKERILPLASSLINRSIDYATKMQVYPAWSKSICFFPNSIGRKYDETSIYHHFRRYLWRAGISHGGRGKGPRVHDFRHTFAVHCLRNWVREGRDLTTALPYLSTYMGHVGSRSTQYYLRLTAELYPDIVLGLDAAYDWMIPEVKS